MQKRWETIPDLALASVVGIAALVVYVMTLTQTVPFWDSGEFIATSYILGIPHPPGTPLYVLLGRVFSLLPVPLTTAEKVNALSALPSAIACALTYLVTARFLSKAGEPFAREGRPSGIARVGAVLASAVMAFSSTFWINAIEAEVYALSSMVMVGAVYLMLQWQELRREGGEEQRRATNLVVLVFYVLSLSIAFHMGTFIVLLPLVMFFLSDFYPSVRDAKFVASAAVLVVLSFFLGLDSERLLITLFGIVLLMLLNVGLGGWKPFLAMGVGFGLLAIVGFLMVKAGVVVGSVIGLVLAVGFFYGTRSTLVRDNLGFWIITVFVLGLSVHLYLPIRAALHPAINEADPSTLRNFFLMVSRDQYKPGPPWEFHGGWETKFYTHFWRYWRPQYDFGVRALWSAPFVLGLAGAVLHAMRGRRTFLLMTFIVLATSIGLIWHLNFSPEEVRDRDYFFVALFHFFAIWIGMGAAAVLYLVREAVRPGVVRRVLVAASAALLLLMPIGQLKANWFTHDRSNFYVARDYAYNILTSVDQNAILFTNGDNDTFPLWYLQEVEGIRKDVRVACLSLMQTDWYIRQLRDEEPKAPIAWSDGEIASLEWYRDARTGKVVGLNDQAVEEIIKTNRWQKPVYFAVTVPSEGLRGFDAQKRVVMEGLAWRVTQSPVPEDVDEQKLVHNLNDVFLWRGVLDAQGKVDHAVYRDENASRLCQNYGAAYLRLGQLYDRRARAFFQQGRDEDAKGEIRKAIGALDRAALFSEGFATVSIATGTLYAQLGEFERSDSVFSALIEEVIRHPFDPEKVDALPELLWRRGNVRYDSGDFKAALADFSSFSDVLPELWEGWEGQIRSLFELGETPKALELTDRWLTKNPTHAEALAWRDRLSGKTPAASNGSDPPAG